LLSINDCKKDAGRTREKPNLDPSFALVVNAFASYRDAGWVSLGNERANWVDLAKEAYEFVKRGQRVKTPPITRRNALFTPIALLG